MPFGVCVSLHLSACVFVYAHALLTADWAMWHSGAISGGGACQVTPPRCFELGRQLFHGLGRTGLAAPLTHGTREGPQRDDHQQGNNTPSSTPAYVSATHIRHQGQI